MFLTTAMKILQRTLQTSFKTTTLKSGRYNKCNFFINNINYILVFLAGAFFTASFYMILFYIYAY